MKHLADKSIALAVGVLLMAFSARSLNAEKTVWANFTSGLIERLEELGKWTFARDNEFYEAVSIGVGTHGMGLGSSGSVYFYYGDSQVIGEFVDRAVDFQLSSDTRLSAIGLLLVDDYSENADLFENDIQLVLCIDDDGKPGDTVARFFGMPFPGEGIANAEGYWRPDGNGYVFQSNFNETVLRLETPYPIEADRRYWIVAKQAALPFPAFRAFSLRNSGTTSVFLERRTDRMAKVDGVWDPEWSEWDGQTHWNWGAEDDYMYDIVEEGKSLALRVYSPSAPQVYLPESVTVEKNDPVSIKVVVGWDAETVSTSGLPAGLSFKQDDGLIAGKVAKSGTWTLTVTASNSEGTTRKNCVITVEEPPVVMTPLSITSQPVGGAVPFGQTLKLSIGVDGSNPAYQWFHDGNPVAGATSSVLTVGPATLVSAGSYTVTATNTFGKVTSVAAVVSIVAGVPSVTPSLVRKAGAVVTEDPDFQAGIAGGQGVLVYYAKGLIKGLKLDKKTGEVTGTITAKPSPVPYTVTYWTQMGKTKGTVVTQKITVEKPLPPVALPASVLVQKPGVPVANWSIRNPDPEAATLAYFAKKLPKGLRLNKATGEITGAITAKSGIYSVTFWSQAGSQKSDSITQTITISRPLPPVALPASMLVQKPGASVTDWSIRNPDPEAATLAYYAKGLPKGLKLNKNTGEITGTITAKSGAYKVTLWAQVAGNKSDSIQQTITISKPLPPIVPAGSPLIVGQGETANWSIRNPSPDASTLTYHARKLPKGLKLDKATGTITGTITVKAGTYTVSVWGQMGGNKSEIRTFDVTVRTSPPPPPSLYSHTSPSPE
ncbi:MAG: putative Ig domain-containing protein [Opitutaceae bacterium]|jgi:hypothetical protein|nr:putative Ig domain-containing protein [Opitutaceae bacterium]